MSGHHSKLSVEKEGTGVTYDHHGAKLDDPSLKGLARIFSNETVRGRANVAKTTMGLFFGYLVYKKLMKTFGGDTDGAIKNQLDLNPPDA
jgi:ATP synthase regulation